ncbi:MAG TPA: dienelactone hydrolase family protein [Kofleriaceae bacterium]|nr:dienelactone hydrolase family protein [Kofleriaceae bacterium]
MTRIDIETEDGVAPAFLSGPPAGPAVLLLMDGIGMRPAMHELAAQIADAGYRVLMPDLFHRFGEYTAPDPAALFSDPAVRAAWWGRHAKTTAASLVRDIGVYLDHIGAPKVGVTGYCMGGRLALSAAATYPDRIAAAAAYHPGGLVTDAADSPHRHLASIRASVYIGGAMEDPTFTDAQRQTIDDALTEANVDHVVELYPARHGWVPSDTPVHDPAAAARHRETLLALFARTLR